MRIHSSKNKNFASKQSEWKGPWNLAYLEPLTHSYIWACQPHNTWNKSQGTHRAIKKLPWLANLGSPGANWVESNGVWPRERRLERRAARMYVAEPPARRRVAEDVPSYDVKIIAGRRVIIYHDESKAGTSSDNDNLVVKASSGLDKTQWVYGSFLALGPNLVARPFSRFCEFWKFGDPFSRVGIMNVWKRYFKLDASIILARFLAIITVSFLHEAMSTFDH